MAGTGLDSIGAVMPPGAVLVTVAEPDGMAGIIAVVVITAHGLADVPTSIVGPAIVPIWVDVPVAAGPAVPDRAVVAAVAMVAVATVVGIIAECKNLQGARINPGSLHWQTPQFHLLEFSAQPNDFRLEPAEMPR